tara:strand:- start:1016 stop:1645 length:630 start_codon:yes stop_codon:yes gene_type:complete
MCAIFGSFKKEKLEELAELNSYRGQLSYSISQYDPEEKKLFLKRKCEGSFNIEDVQLDDGCYYIAHIQAPTTAASAIDSIHPSARNETGDLLWHNGILKESFVKQMQEALPSEQLWDTGLLHDWLLVNKDISEVDGTFSCARYIEGDGMFLFRNEISPLFIDEHINISSTKFEGSKPTTPNEVLRIDFENGSLVTEDTFTTKENPYYFG